MGRVMDILTKLVAVPAKVLEIIRQGVIYKNKTIEFDSLYTKILSKSARALDPAFGPKLLSSFCDMLKTTTFAVDGLNRRWDRRRGQTNLEIFSNGFGWCRIFFWINFRFHWEKWKRSKYLKCQSA